LELLDKGDLLAVRTSAVIIAGITELEAFAMYRRVTGIDPGTLKERIVR
jgi:hypothetical protein